MINVVCVPGNPSPVPRNELSTMVKSHSMSRGSSCLLWLQELKWFLDLFTSNKRMPIILFSRYTVSTQVLIINIVQIHVETDQLL